MKKIFLFLVALLLTVAEAFAQDDYYFGGRGKLDPSIPTPEAFFGFQIGKSLVRYDKVVEYFKLLADKSDRASLEIFGKTYENREQVALIISSPENQKNLDNIRAEHWRLIDPTTSVNLDNQKIIVHLGYNVHGGEIAGTDASVLAAYYFVASQDPEIIRSLNEAVVLIEPSLNPDGRERATNYINGFESVVPVADPADRGHGSGITPHRGNHFWTDLNRDWLSLSQIESQNRVIYYHKWYPNIYIDYHEMGSESTYYFEPAPANKWDPAIPQSTFKELDAILADYFSKALNNIGSLYYTKENFTSLFPFYGSTYPEYQGGAGSTLEIGSTSGIEIETEAGIRTFSKNLRDHLATGIAALKAATEKKNVFLNHQKDFFKSALAQADKSLNKYIVFGSEKDKGINRLFLNHLLQHKINVYELTENYSQDGKEFKKGNAYVIPYRQAQYYVLSAIFSEQTNYKDPSAFNDISAQNIVYGFGVPFVKVKGTIRKGNPVTQLPEVKGTLTGRSEYAYAFKYFDYLGPKVLYFLQDKGVKARVAGKSFTTKTTDGQQSFERGSIVIPVHYQDLSPDELYQILKQAAALSDITISALTDGLSSEGIDLGSNNIRVIKKPVVATVTDKGSNWTDIGELWDLLSNRFHIPLTKIDAQSIERTDLSRYTAIVLTGSIRFSREFTAKLTDWVENGGTLITTETASNWAISSKLATGLLPDMATRSSRSEKEENPFSIQGRERLNGAILKAVLNLESPLTYGFLDKDFYILKTSLKGLPRTAGADGVVLETTSGDPIDGYISQGLREKLKNNPVIVSTNRGKGSVILFGESPTFRGFYLASGRILTNAIFFGGENSRSRR